MEDAFAFLKKAAIDERLRFTGYLSDEDLRALYSTCRIFIYPSLYEGFGLPPLEAMACGAPVVAGRVPALQEVLGRAARLVDPLNVEALAGSIVELIENDEERRRLASNGPKHAAKFSWKETARRTLKVYRDAVSEARP